MGAIVEAEPLIPAGVGKSSFANPAFPSTAGRLHVSSHCVQEYHCMNSIFVPQARAADYVIL